MKRILLLSTLVLWASATMAQAPSGYYNAATGKSGAQLKAALNDIISGHTTYPYSSSSTDVWDILKVADRDPNNSANVIGLYSGFSMNAAAEYDNGAGWNREHVWAKSRGDFGTTQGAGTDLHHLRVEDVSTNSARNNRSFDEAPTQYIDGSGNYQGATDSRTSSTDWIWEPRDEVKGDVARMMFYMVVRYEGENGDPDLELTEDILSNTDKSPFHGKLSVLLAWHAQDPVSSEEMNRNNVVYGYQNNRNPFIDNPSWVNSIWGGGGGTTANVTFTLVTDNYPSETTWILKKGSTTVASGSNYSQANTTYDESYNLSDGDYAFTINDAYGDGICCSYGNGSYTWKNGSTTLTSGGSFGSSQTRTFTIGSGSGGGGGSSTADIVVTIKTDNYPSETTWQVLNSGGTTLGGGGPYSTANTTYNKTLTLPAGDYVFVINDQYGDGICCSYGNGSYTVKNGSTTLASGGSFGSTESKSFAVVASRGVGLQAVPGSVVETTPEVTVQVLAYPNPARGAFSVSMPVKTAGTYTLTVTDMLGHRLYTEASPVDSKQATWTLTADRWEPGLYVVSIADEAGNLQHTTLMVE